MAFKVNDIEYYHQQMLYSSCLEVVIIFFSLGEVSDVFYGWSPAKSFPASSSMVVSWQPTTFLPLVDPGRTAAIWRFSKSTLLTEAVTVSLRVTPVASKIQPPNQSSHNQHTPSFPFTLVVWGKGAI